MSGLGPPPDRIEVTTDQVRRLIAAQFPQWSALPVSPVANGGWDNRTFHLGDHMSVRLPSAAEYARAVDKEHRWLPALSPHLPLPVPTPLAKGRPGAGYPFAWSVYRWLDGAPATAAGITDPVRFALDLAAFIAALRAVEKSEGPGPGTHNWFRGGPLRRFDELARTGLTDLTEPHWAEPLWAEAMDTPWDGVPRWFHGDVAAGNLLLRDGRLGAVIDFGTCGVGDPACDLAVAWTLLTAEGRQAFRDHLGVDDAEWIRGRGWALWKALATDDVTVLDEILFDVSPNQSYEK
jgi:aminoglycoside phosphotransferase (APT) family kinase protein